MFTKNMSRRLVELVRDNADSLFPNSRRPNAETERVKAWRLITETLNNEFTESRLSEKQVQDKWRNLKISAKEDAQTAKKYPFIFNVLIIKSS